MSKNIYKNAIYNMLYKVLSVIFPLITATYIARVLLPEGLGKVTYAQTMVTYFLMFATLGIPNYGIREIAKTSNIEDRSKTFIEIFTISTISSLICSIVFYTLVYTTNLFGDDKALYYVTGLLLVFNFINVDWVYQGTEEYKFIALRSLVIKVVFTISLFVFVRKKEDYILYSLLYCLANGGNYFLNVVRLRKYVHPSFSGIDIKKHLRAIFVLFSATISNEVYLHLDITMLGIMCGDEYVGYYTNSSKLMHVISNALIALGAVILPRLSYYLENNQLEDAKKTISRFLQLLLWISIPATVGLFMVSDKLIPVLFGQLYIPSITTLKIHSILVMEFAIEGGILCPVLIATKKEKYYSIATLAGAVSNIATNYFLINLWQHNGAAIASAISKAVIIIIEIIYIKEYFEVKNIIKGLLNILIAVVVMGCFVGGCGIIVRDYKPVVSLLIETTVGIAGYWIALKILKDKLLLSVENKLFAKIKRGNY